MKLQRESTVETGPDLTNSQFTALTSRQGDLSLKAEEGDRSFLSKIQGLVEDDAEAYLSEQNKSAFTSQVTTVLF